MNYSYSRYELNPWSDRGTAIGRPREGALLRVDFGFGKVGYADCHPWPELGDLSVDTQLQALRIGANTPILEQSMSFARADANARAQGVSLFEGLLVPQSHASFPYSLGRRPYTAIAESHLLWAMGLGFDTIKLKAGNAPVAEIQQLGQVAPFLLEHGLKVRLDFNEKLSYNDLVGFMEGLEQEAGGDLSWIEWLEDPCLYDSREWDRIRESFGLKVAIDRALVRDLETISGGFDVFVLKPAVQEVAPLLKVADLLSMPVAFTSYLDHPFGQVCAAWVAAKASLSGVQQMKGGLVTHFAYEPNEFSEQLSVANARLIPPRGTGFGFDEDLEDMEWEELR